MEGSGTSGNSQASYSTTPSADSSSVKIRILVYLNSKATFSASDGKLEIAEGDIPHLVRLRNDTSYEDFEKILSPLSWSWYNYNRRYYLPGHGFISLRTEADFTNMLEEFGEMNRIQGPQMFNVFADR